MIAIVKRIRRLERSGARKVAQVAVDAQSVLMDAPAVVGSVVGDSIQIVHDTRRNARKSLRVFRRARDERSLKRWRRGALVVFMSIVGVGVLGLAFRRLRARSSAPAATDASSRSKSAAADDVEPDPAPQLPDAGRVNARAASLLAEEALAGSDNPELQAQTILAESDARTDDRIEPPGPSVEHRTSEETVTPPIFE
jgi:hypothetical protein